MTDTDHTDSAPQTHGDVLHTGAAGGRVIRGGVIRAAGFGVGILFGLGTAALLLRHLGVVDYGKYGTVAALLGLVLALSDGGLTTIGVRELSVARGLLGGADQHAGHGNGAPTRDPAGCTNDGL